MKQWLVLALVAVVVVVAIVLANNQTESGNKVDIDVDRLTGVTTTRR